MCENEKAMNNEDDNIQFEQMPDLDWNWGKNQKVEIVETEKEYDSLYDELFDKCNPSKFNIETFGLDKFNEANEIFAQLTSLSSNSTEKELVALRDQAIDELGVLISTKKKFNDLKSFLDPEQYIKRQPYDKELVAEVGALYSQLLAHKNDIRALEMLESQPQVALIKDEHDYLSLGAAEYLKKHPEGNHKVEAEESIRKIQYQIKLREEQEEETFYRWNPPTEYLIKYPNGKHAKRAKEILEEAEFVGKSAEEYLSHYPQGRFVEEARTYIKDRPCKYLKAYPKGRYSDDAKSVRNVRIFLLVLFIPLIVAIIYSIIQ